MFVAKVLALDLILNLRQIKNLSFYSRSDKFV